MPRPPIFDPSRLPGAILLPTYQAVCRSCGERTTHAGLGDEDGRELDGSFCVWCGEKSERRVRDWRDDPDERAKFEADAAKRGLMTSDLPKASGA